MYYVYVVRSESTGKIYVGQTNNIEKRLQRHNKILKVKKTNYTYKNKGPWALVYEEKLFDRKTALKREKQLKSARGREFIKSKISARSSVGRAVAF